ncbi:hypothetical protein AAFF_G00136430 [Aldrovandia affinis]|uniref:Uncharacterized protein n=1 Tax=Aldrovandia affinis TaxID=143900 RepID=A0AAD7RQB2_9TELE|nr:hypothetical protein AAFF_G00136430 [Aldrovandia affinis]
MTKLTMSPEPEATAALMTASLAWGDQDHTLKAMVDSGAAGNFLDIKLAKELEIPLTTLEPPLTVTALDGRPLGSGRVHHLTVPLWLSLENNHSEVIQLHLIRSPKFPLILGYPWLACHNPRLDWPTGQLTTLIHPRILLSLQPPLKPSSSPKIPAHFLQLLEPRISPKFPSVSIVS